jgi:hypothetical protein
VDELQVDVQNRLFSRLVVNYVGIPDFLEHRTFSGSYCHIERSWVKSGCEPAGHAGTKKPKIKTNFVFYYRLMRQKVNRVAARLVPLVHYLH